MFCSCGLHRRGVLRLAGGLAALAVTRLQGARAQGAPSPGPDATALPARGEFVLRGGHVLTMDASLGDLPEGDVHVRDGAIVAVGRSLDAPGRAGDRGARHDRAAGLRRHALASVVHGAAAGGARRRSAGGIFSDHDPPRPPFHAAGFLCRRAARRRRGTVVRHHHGARLVAQHGVAAARRRRAAGAARHRHPRALLLWHRRRALPPTARWISPISPGCSANGPATC